jgi:hypothetical protein
MKSIKILTLFVLITLSAVMYTSCKKYEEGPAFSLRSKKARVVGKWKVEKAFNNGNDITSTVNVINPRYEFKKNGDLIVTITFFGVSDSETWKWEFNDDKERIISIEPNGNKEELQILRLKNKELWVKNTKDTDIDEIHFALDE